MLRDKAIFLSPSSSFYIYFIYFIYIFIYLYSYLPIESLHINAFYLFYFSICKTPAHSRTFSRPVSWILSTMYQSFSITPTLTHRHPTTPCPSLTSSGSFSSSLILMTGNFVWPSYVRELIKLIDIDMYFFFHFHFVMFGNNCYNILHFII